MEQEDSADRLRLGSETDAPRQYSDFPDWLHQLGFPSDVANEPDRRCLVRETIWSCVAGVLRILAEAGMAGAVEFKLRVVCEASTLQEFYQRIEQPTPTISVIRDISAN